MPASLLRSRPVRLSGSGIGPFDMRDYLPLVADQRVTLDVRTFPLEGVEDAWADAIGPQAALTAT
ncbi:hypothetical protein [Streptomyces sp. NBC_00690]|uniref:hypothetical protein n=1 Tax=Streptomyces sp. NBC_00690 TaxID=2975808 RepID=UPI002E2DDDE9|nr:hypothetical protein [Streptomyces sp. NBC_00690]